MQFLSKSIEFDWNSIEFLSKSVEILLIFCRNSIEILSTTYSTIYGFFIRNRSTCYLNSIFYSAKLFSNFYRSSIETLSKFYRNPTELLSKLCPSSIDILSETYQTSIEILWTLYQTSIEALLKSYRQSMDSLLNFNGTSNYIPTLAGGRRIGTKTARLIPLGTAIVLERK